jgi:hypothetical protein
MLLSHLGTSDPDDESRTRLRPPRIVHPGVRGRGRGIGIGDIKRAMSGKLSGGLATSFDKVVKRAVAQQRLDQWRASHLSRIHIEKGESGIMSKNEGCSPGNASCPNWEEAVDVYDREVR